MIDILIFSSRQEMRFYIQEILSAFLHRSTKTYDKRVIINILDDVWQVLIYEGSSSEDLSWLTEQMARHPELRVVYLSPAPWASLGYERARCMISPIGYQTLNSALMLRLVQELLPPQPLDSDCEWIGGTGLTA